MIHLSVSGENHEKNDKKISFTRDVRAEAILVILAPSDDKDDDDAFFSAAMASLNLNVKLYNTAQKKTVQILLVC